MKTPVSYYGGKQRLASKIVPMIPKHTVYVEPFAGGAAVMFRKPWPAITSQSDYREVINDLDGDLVNFYKQLRDKGPELVDKLQLTLYSEEEHKLSKELDIEDELERARRYYVNSQQSFSNVVGRGWRRGVVTRNSAVTWMNKVAELPEYLDRMAGVHISNTDALKCIEQWDSPQTFFYVDPPYPGADQGYQHKYSLEEFTELCEVLCDIQGSFILSCYEVGLEVEGLVDWERLEFKTTCSGKTREGYDRSKKGDETNQNRTRTEVVYRKLSTAPLRPEIQKLYNSGKFDCFTG